MTDKIRRRDFLAQHGARLIDQGYVPVPIQPGKKAPGYDGWQKSRGTKAEIREWVEHAGFANAGVGILTRFTCAVDIDCLDETTALKFEAWCVENIGPPLVRIGKAPKRLLLYRTTEPFRKRRSTVYLDEWKDKQLIEVLGDGQQFVAFHVHPDTGKEYVWVDDKSPLNTRAADLTEITTRQIDELLAAFEEHADGEKWDVHKPARNAAQSKNMATAEDNPWIEDSAPIQITDDELRTRLLLVPGAEDYDTWFQVGMALYHQYAGDALGLDLWNEWSETADNYDKDALERHWPTFDVGGKKRAPLTARFIIRLAKEAIEKTALELGVKLRDAFINAKDLSEWEKARQMTREAEIDSLARSQIASVAKETRDNITRVKTPLVEIKRALSYLPKRNEKMPSWCEGWVYDVSDDRFFNIDRKLSCTKTGFDAMYDRKALSKADIINGKMQASQKASDLALTMYSVPTVDGRRYVPGRDNIFHEADGVFANTYPEHEIPEKPAALLPRDKKNIERIRKHLAHLIADEDEQRMALDWFAWIVQNPGKHVNYALLLQGVEGDGKSFFGEMLRAVMGVTNVKMANGDTVIKSNFTDWGYGQCVCVMEEVRMSGSKTEDKWAAINKIKPFITNHILEIHPKGSKAFNAINTTSYLLLSNFKDALPLDENSRRYLVIFSVWQRKEDIQRFKTENPRYYERLYGTLNESAGAIRQWLLEHECSESFNPLGDAPETKALATMVRKSKPEFIQVLDDIIADDKDVCASRHLLDITELSDVVMSLGVDWPGPKALASMLERDGYENLGKVKLSSDARHRFYSKNPSKFYDHDGTVNHGKVRNYIRARKEALDDPENDL